MRDVAWPVAATVPAAVDDVLVNPQSATLSIRTELADLQGAHLLHQAPKRQLDHANHCIISWTAPAV